MFDNRYAEYPFGFDESKTTAEINFAIINRLIETKAELNALTEDEERGLEALGTELRGVRKELELTRSELARSTGINPAFLALLEAGRVPLQEVTETTVLDTLAAALSISKNELLLDSLYRYTNKLLD